MRPSHLLHRLVSCRVSLKAAGCCAAAAAIVSVSCAQGIGGTTSPISDTPTGDAPGDDDDESGDPDNGDMNVDPDSSAFGQSDGGDDALAGDDGGGDSGRGADSGRASDAGVEAGTDAGESGTGGDSGYTGPVCSSSVPVLYLDEIMIASVSGDGDKGEWVEIWNPSTTCGVKLVNITVISPRGSSGDSDVAALNDGWVIPPRGFVVVADSSASSDNHGLPGPVYSWNSSGVLSNSGADSVSILSGTSAVDTLSFDSTFTDGFSIEFPSDCNVDAIGEFPEAWQQADTSSTYGPLGLHGTPNAANNDVTCD